MKPLFFKLCRQWKVGTFLILGLFCLAYVAFADTLTVTIAGSGTGSVNSSPAGISCTSSSSPCSATFANMSGITLNATPDWKSLNAVFSVGCSGTGSCFLNINGDTGVTARFDPDLQAALIIVHPELEPKFSSLTTAYGYAVTNGNNNFVLAARENTFSEDLLLTDPIFFTLAGGMDSGYYTNIGFTTLNGYLEVQDGSVTIDSLIIQ